MSWIFIHHNAVAQRFFFYLWISFIMVKGCTLNIYFLLIVKSGTFVNAVCFYCIAVSITCNYYPPLVSVPGNSQNKPAVVSDMNGCPFSKSVSMKRHILLIDDDKDEMLILSEAMQGAGIGCKCTWAQSVDHALNILTYIRPDIVFIDLNMPVTDGLEGIRCIRQLHNLADMPIVLYSNFIGNAAGEAISLGANYCIQKQTGIYALSEQLNELFLQTDIAESLP